LIEYLITFFIIDNLRVRKTSKTIKQNMNFIQM